MRGASVVAWVHGAPLSVLVKMLPVYSTAASLVPSDEDAIESQSGFASVVAWVHEAPLSVLVKM